MSNHKEFSGFINNLSMAKKLFVVPIIILAAMLINATITVLDSHAIEYDVNHINTQALPTSSMANKLLQNSYQARILTLNYLSSQDEKYITAIKKLQNQNSDLLTKISQQSLNNNQLKKLTIIKNDNQKYYDTVLNQVIPKKMESLNLIHDITDNQAKFIITKLHQLQALLDPDLALIAAKAIEHAQNAEVKLLIYTTELDESYYQQADKQLKELEGTIKELSQSTLFADNLTDIAEIENAVKNFYNESKNIKTHTVELNQLLTHTLPKISDEIVASSQYLQDESSLITQKDTQHAYMLAEQLITTVETTTLISFLISVFLVIYISRKINAPIKHLAAKIKELKHSGDFTIRSGIHSKDEIGMISETFDAMLCDQSATIEQIKSVMKEISEGRFDGRIENNLLGDFLELKNSINKSAEQLELTFNELNRVNHCLANGDFDQSIDIQLKGLFKETADSTNTTIDLLHQFVSETNMVMEQVSEGHLNHRISIKLPGELNTLKTYINNTVQNVENAITEIKRVVQAQADGNFSETIQGQYQGDFDELKTSINQSAEEVNRIVSQIKQSAYAVQHAVNEVEVASMDLSSRTQEQAASIEETAASLEEITATVEQHNDSTQDANQLIHDTNTQSKSGIKLVEEAQSSMAKISESSSQIAEIITLIDSIAFQTNLLALNAAVEAARAGEHGRGFAVVASEVRNLAQKSAEAASSIKDIIDRSVNQVKQGESLVQDSGKMLLSINTAISSITDNIEHISDSSKQEKTGISQINIAVAQIDEITQQNAALSEETASAASQMLDETNEMIKALEFFKSSQTPKRLA